MAINTVLPDKGQGSSAPVQIHSKPIVPDKINVAYSAHNGPDSLESVTEAIRALVTDLRMDEAEQMTSQLADNGLAFAWSILADTLYAPETPACNADKWLACKERHARAGGLNAARASLELGLFQYRENRFDTSVEWFEKAALAGSEEGAILLGFAFLRGEGVQINPLRAIRWFLRSLSLPKENKPLTDRAEWPVSRASGWQDWELFRDVMRNASPHQRTKILDLIIPSEYIPHPGTPVAQNGKGGDKSGRRPDHTRNPWVMLINLGAIVAIVMLIIEILITAQMHDTSHLTAAIFLMILPVTCLIAINLQK